MRTSRSTSIVGLLTFLFTLTFTSSAHAQWQSTTYTLRAGWNAIYLHGDATHTSIETLFPPSTNIKAIWRWNSNPTPTQFNTSPLIPAEGTSEWTVWTRVTDDEEGLTTLTGQTAYLVECDGAVGSTYTVPIVQKVLPPRATWVRNGANFLGFPSRSGSGGYPTFASYFATFPVAVATNSKIYKYDGGELAPSNPIQVFSPTTEVLDRNQAYWFEAAVVSNFTAPLEIAPSNPDGLIFGRNGSLIKVQVRNRTAASVNLTVAPVDSAAAPTGPTGVPPRVPLTYREFKNNTFEFRAVTAGNPVPLLVPPQSTVELSFGVDRSAITGEIDALYASLLRFTDGGNLMDVYLPVSARVASLSGLWVGDVTVTNVGNRVPSQNFSVDVTRTTGSAVTLSGGGGGVGAAGVASIGVAASGSPVAGITLTNAGIGYTSVPTVSFSGGGGSGATATASGQAGVASIVLSNGGSGYATAPAVTLMDGGGTGASATARLAAGSVGSVNLTSNGSGYTTSPTVLITGGGGDGATAQAVINGAVSALTLTNGGGTAYASPPEVSFSGGGGSGATATAVLRPLKVWSVTMTNKGSGYTSFPTVQFSGNGGATANVDSIFFGEVSGVRITNRGSYATAPTVTFNGGGGAGATGVVSALAEVESVNLSNPGSGYTSAPSVAFSNSGGAAATASIAGPVASITVTNGGSGYTSAPTVSFDGGGSGSGATATASIGAAVSGIDVTSSGGGYSSPPIVSLSGGGGASATAVLSPLALSVALTNGGSGYTSAPTVAITGGGGSGATATATLVQSSVAGVGVLSGGTGYTSAPTVSISGGSNAVVTAKINGVTAVTISNGGTGYTAAPTVSFSDGGGSGAAAVATVVDLRVVDVTITDSGAGYTSAPTVTLDGGGGTGATATAAIASGSVTGFTVTDAGSGYAPPVITTETDVLAVGSGPSTLAPVKLPAGTDGTLTYQWKKNGQPIAGATSPTLVLGADEATASGAFGTGTARPFTLRTIVHVGDNGTVRLLPHAFLGKLNAAPNNLGICTSEALLLPSALATARRFSTIHLPPEVESFGTSGAFALGQTLFCTVPLAYDAPTNPFVHTYHPDHDNRNPRFDATLPAGIESPAISRALSFTFTPTPPAGVSAQGWGSAVIGGTYSETVTGIHKNPTTVNGTFQLRRVSELGSLTTN